MVRLSTSTSLLAFALATGSAQAFSDEYQRRSELDSNLYDREFIDSQEIPFTREVDLEDIYGRQYFDDLEAREPQGIVDIALGATRIGQHVLKSAVHGVSSFLKSHHRREFIDSQEIPFTREVDLEDLYGREFQDFDDLEAREPQGLFSTAFKFGGTVLKSVGKNAAEHAVSHSNSNNHKNKKGHARRGLEAEELFGREYYELDERDIFDDLDLD